ncbi:MAG: CPXCG motif-containing cysteine-rich protein [Roseimicrobium sp.]
MEVTCPTCFENFDVPEPHVSEVPCSVDYDCEICCRPMVIAYWEEDGEVAGEATGLAD